MKIELPDGSEGHLRLVHSDKTDAAILAKWRTEHFDNFFTRIKPNIEDVLSWLRNYECDDTDLMFLIEYPPGIPIGQLSLSKIDLNEKSAEFGRMIRGRKAALKDIMQIASMSLVEWAFHTFELKRIHLCVFADNVRALNFYSRIGFRMSERRDYRKMLTPEGMERYVDIGKEMNPVDEDQIRSVLIMTMERNLLHSVEKGDTKN